MADLSPEEAVALLSALVFQEKSDAEPVLPPALAAATEQLAAIAHQAGVAQAEAGLPLHPEEFARSVLKFGLVEVRCLARSSDIVARVAYSDALKGKHCVLCLQLHRHSYQVPLSL